jgi:hypothetical protein
MNKKAGLMIAAMFIACHAQYWAAHTDNRDIMANYMDYGVSSPVGILKGQPINFIVSGYSTMEPCVDELEYLLEQHEKATGTIGLYKVVNAIIIGTSMLKIITCPPAYVETDNYRTIIGKMVSGKTNVLLADQSPSGLCAPTCDSSAKGDDNISGINDAMTERYAVYMDTVTSRFLRSGFDKVYFNSHLYYSGRKQGMCFQWYGMYKFFKEHPKANVYPGPYTCGISSHFYPTGYKDTNHPDDNGPIAKIVGLGWYATIAGEDAVDKVMQPYIDSINAYDSVPFPVRDYISAIVKAKTKIKTVAKIPVCITSGTIFIKTDADYAVRLINLSGKTVYALSGRGVGNYRLPPL